MTAPSSRISKTRTDNNQETQTEAAPAQVGAARERAAGKPSSSAVAPGEDKHEVAESEEEDSAGAGKQASRSLVASFWKDEPAAPEKASLKSAQPEPVAEDRPARTEEQWAEVSQEDTNKEVNKLVTEMPDDSPESYRRVVDNLDQMEEDQLIVALAQLPEDADSDKIAAALQAKREEKARAEGQGQDYDKVRQQSLAFANKLDQVRDVRDQIAAAAGTDENFQTGPAAAALRSQMESHPELADLIARSNLDTIDQVSARLAFQPEGSDAAVLDLVAAAEKLDPKTIQDTLATSLESSLHQNMSPVLAGLTQGQLQGQNKLLGALESRLDGEAKTALSQARIDPALLDQTLNPPDDPEIQGQIFPNEQLTRLTAFAKDKDPNVVRGLMNYLDQREPNPLEQMVDSMSRNSLAMTGGDSGTDLRNLSSLLASSDPALLDRVAGRLSENVSSWSHWDTLGSGMTEAIGQGAPALSLALVDKLAQSSDNLDGLLTLRESLSFGFGKLSETYGEAASVTQQHNADLAYLEQQYGAFGDPGKLEQAKKDFRDGFAGDYARTDKLAGASLQGLQMLKELDSKHPDLMQEVGSDEGGYLKLLSQFESLAATPAGMQQVTDALEVKGAGGVSFLNDLGSAASLTGDSQSFKENTDYLITHAMQLGQSQILATGKGPASNSLRGWAATAKELGVGLTPQEIDELVLQVEELGDAALEAAGGASQTALTELADKMIAPSGAGPVSQRQAVARGTAAAIGMGMAGWDLANGVDGGSEVYDLLATALPAGTDVGSLVAEWRGATSLAKGLGSVSPIVSGISGVIGVIDLMSEISDPDSDGVSIGLQATLAAGNIAAGVGGIVGIWGSASWAGPVGWAGAALATVAGLGLAQYDRVQFSNRFEVGNGQLSDQAKKFLDTILPEDFNRDLIPALLNASDEGELMGGTLQEMATLAGVTPQSLIRQFGQLSPDQASELIETIHQIRWITAEMEAPPEVAVAWSLSKWQELNGGVH